MLPGVAGTYCGQFDERAWRAAVHLHVSAEDPRVLGLLQEKLPVDSEEHRLAETALAASLRGTDLTKQILALSREQTLNPTS